MAATVLLATAILAAHPYQETVAAALADAQTVNPGSRSQLLYLLVTSEDDLPAVSYAINAVSRTRVIRQPKIVGQNLIRVQLAWLYGTDLKAAKEILAARERLDEDYFTVLAPGTRGAGAELRRVRAALSPDYAQLQQICYSAIPLMRADQFVSQVLGEARHYYAWSGVPKKLNDYLGKNLALDVKAVERVRAQLEAAMSSSGITEKDRIVVGLNAPFGPAFITNDVLKASDDNPAVAPQYVTNAFKFKFDAHEIFALKSNGLWEVSLFNAAGDRQDVVPSAIATDDLGTSGRGEVIPLVSCIRCHEARGSSGLQPLRDSQVVVPSIGEPDIIQRLSDTHDADRMGALFDFGGTAYIKAVARVTAGMKREGDHVRALIPTEATAAFVGVYERFTAPVTIEVAAKELGLSKEDAILKLKTSTATAAYELASGATVNRKAWAACWRTLTW